jgi:hypothetical protein
MLSDRYGTVILRVKQANLKHVKFAVRFEVLLNIEVSLDVTLYHWASRSLCLQGF